MNFFIIGTLRRMWPIKLHPYITKFPLLLRALCMAYHTCSWDVARHTKTAHAIHRIEWQHESNRKNQRLLCLIMFSLSSSGCKLRSDCQRPTHILFIPLYLIEIQYIHWKTSCSLLMSFGRFYSELCLCAFIVRCILHCSHLDFYSFLQCAMTTVRMQRQTSRTQAKWIRIGFRDAKSCSKCVEKMSYLTTYDRMERNATDYNIEEGWIMKPFNWTWIKCSCN